MSLHPDTKKAVADRLQFYRDLGIYSFYRRSEAPVEEASVEGAASHAEAHPTATILEDPLPRAAAQPVKTISAGAQPATLSPEFFVQLAAAQDKQQAFAVIRAEIGDCVRCRLSQARNKIVFGVGDPDADIMFIGEGPGADEDAQGEPFIGRAGQLLNNMITAMGIQREDVYIANVVKCRPPGNRTPERDECDTCSPFLMQQIDVVKPKVIVALGAVAAKNLLQVNDTMGNLRGKFYDFKDSKLAVTYHPAYLLRDPRQKSEAWKDLQMVMKELGMTPPKGKKE